MKKMVEFSTRRRTVARVALVACLGFATVTATGTATGAAPASSRSVPGSRCRPPAGYVNVDIGALGSGYNDAVDVNNRGVVVGRSETPEGMHVFVWRRGRMTDITPPGGTDGAVVGVNDRGEVAHSWLDPAAGGYRTAIWRNGRSTVILAGYGQASDLNERGEVLFFDARLWRRGMLDHLEGDIEGRLVAQQLGDGGHAAGVVVPVPPPGGGHPGPAMGFVWHDGVLTPAVPPPGTSFRNAVDVDNSGRVLFDAYASSFALWHDGQTTDLGGLGGDSMGAVDLNEHGQVVGSATTASGEPHAFLWEDGTMTDLHPVEGLISWANKVNERGEAAGAVAVGSPGGGSATVWSCGRAIPLDIAGAVASIAVDINDRGQVLSAANTIQGDRVILSTPIRR
jgi:probable HAF family extracellular repeat protein